RGDVLLQRYATKVDGKYVELPLAVIVNQNSASAAEIVAACLQDHHRAVIVGERSFGKGTVQQLLPVGTGLLKLTWARFWRPSGANIQREDSNSTEGVWAVSPDAGYECKLSADEYAGFRSYRDQRDEGNESSGKAADFADKPLDLAVRGLVSKLQSSKP
ncbi:MAG TPA: S41 family peptidase, partial [Lacipirellulaceae bacterium]|nr:S41 family peptidase [Lacipirellulaceae bacterium]